MLKDNFLTWIFLSWKLNLHQSNPKAYSLQIIHGWKRYVLNRGWQLNCTISVGSLQDSWPAAYKNFAWFAK